MNIEEKFKMDLKDLTEEIECLLLNKRKDYGSSFQESCDMFGLMAPLIRMFDKFKRLSNLIKENKGPINESIEDTFLDICGYSILSILWMRNKKEENKNDS